MMDDDEFVVPGWYKRFEAFFANRKHDMALVYVLSVVIVTLALLAFLSRG